MAMAVLQSVLDRHVTIPMIMHYSVLTYIYVGHGMAMALAWDWHGMSNKKRANRARYCPHFLTPWCCLLSCTLTPI